MKKRILSLLLALVMVIGMLPAVAFAAEGTEVTPSVDYSGQVASDVKLALDEETGLPVLTWNNPAGYGEYSLNYRVLASTDGTTWTSLIKTNIIPCPLYEYLPANTSPYTHFKVVTLDSNLADVTGTDSNIATGSITVAETASSNTAVSVALSGTTSAATVEISGLFAETALVMFQAENFDEDGNRTAECRMASVSDCTATFNEWDLSAYTSYTITEVSASYDDTPSVCTVVRNTSVTSATLDKSGLSDDTTDYSTLIATGVAITSDSSTGLPVLTWNNPAGCEEYSLDYRVLASTDGTTWNDNIVDTNTIPAELYRHLPASDTPYTYFKVITLDSNRNPVTGTDSNIATGSITITESSVSSDTVNVALSGTTSAATVEISGLADDTSVVIFTARNAETKKGTSKVLTVSGGSASYTHRTLALSAYTTYTVTEIAGKCDTATSSYTVTRNTSASGNLSDLWDNGTGEDSETGSTTVGQNDFGLTLTVGDNLLYYQLTLPATETAAEAYFVDLVDSDTNAMYSCSVWAKKDYMDPMYVTAQAGTYDTVKVFAMDADGSEGDLLAQWTLTTPITVTTGAATLPADLALKVVENESSADGVVYQLTGSTSTSVAYCVCDVDAENSGSMYMLEDDNKLCTESLNNDPVKLYSLCAETDGKQFTLDISAPMSLSVPAYEGEETESDLTRAGICVEIVEAMGWTYSEDMAVTFNDVDSTHDAYTAIAIMVSKGHIKGYATGEFDPDGDLTRAEVAKILCSVLKKDGEVDTDVLPGDILADNWAAGYICTALNEGLMWTFEDDCFRDYAPAVGSDVDFDKLAFYAGNAWTLTFDFNTDDSELWVGTNKTYVRKGDAAKLLVRGEDFERPYYVFQGWFTEAEGGTQVTDETVIDGDMTLYAHWEKRTTFALILYVSEILGYDENGDPYGDYVKPGTYTVAMTGPNGTTITAKEGTGEGDAPLIYSGLVAAEAENYTLTIERDGYKNYTITMAGDPYGQGSSLADMGLYMGSVIFSTAGVWQPLSGSCGDNVSWTLTDTSENQDGSAYTLTVFKVDTTLADGWMYHMDSAKEQPWAWARQEITKIVVKDGVQNVGSYAFAMCRNVTEVVLPDSVTEIAERSFVNCSGLTSLALPYVVVQIDSTAFYNCTGLTEFKMGEAPEMENGETPVCWYTVKDGVLFRLVWTTSEDGTETSSPDELVCYPAVKTLTDENGDAVTVYSIPDGTRIIGESAFRSCNLTEIVIPASVSNVMPYAFDRCFDLTAITVAKDNEQYTTNGDGVLYYVVDAETANWTLVCYPAAKEAEAYELPAAVTDIQDGAFGRCFNLTAITVAEGNTMYIAEDGVLFTSMLVWDEATEANVTVPDTLICYPECKVGSSYTAPESMSMIGEGAFAYANVSEIILSGWVHVGDYAFEKCNGGIISITFDEEGAGFGSEAFAGTSDVICYYPAGSMVWENMMNDGNDHWYGGDNVTWKAVYDDSKAVTDLKIVKNEHNDEYYLSWTELEGEHEYRIFLQVTNEDGEQEWREFGRTNRNRWDMNDLPEDEFSAIKVETLNEYDYAVAQTILDASITVEVLEKGGTEPESVTFIRMEKDSAEFLFVATGLAKNTPYRVIFTKINENGEPDEWGVTWNTDKNGAIKVEINPNCDPGLTEWFYSAIEEEVAATYQIYEVTFDMDETTGALTVTRSACGDAADVIWCLDGSDELMDDAYAVTDLQFKEGHSANGTALHNLTWTAPTGNETTVIDTNELEYVVYFYTRDALETETDEEGNETSSIDWSAWTARREVGNDTWLNLLELAEKPYEYIAVKVVTRQNGITRAEVTSNLHTLTVSERNVPETIPGVVVYRKDAEGHDYAVKITGLTEYTWYHFKLRANNDEGRNEQAGDTWFSGNNTEFTFEACGDWITEAFADADDDFHSHYSLKELSSVMAEDETSQHVSLSYYEVVYEYNPTYTDMPMYEDDQVKVTNVHFEIADGTPYLCWDAPANALAGLTYHVMFDYVDAETGENRTRGWGVDGLKITLHDNMPIAAYTAIRVITEANGIEGVGEVTADVTLTITETEDSEAKLTIWENYDSDGNDRFLFSGLTANSKFRFEALAEAENPDGPSFSNNLESEANGTCENNNGNWFMDEYNDGVYRIIEPIAVIEGSALTITNSTTGWKNVADAIAVQTTVEKVTVSGGLTVDSSVTTAASGVTVDLVEESVEVKADELENLTDEDGNKVEITEDTTVAVTGVTLKIEVTDYQIPVEDEETGETVGDTTTLVLDITPVATMTVSKETVNEETGATESKVIATKTGAEVNTVGTPVVVTIPLPTAFVEAAGWNLYVIHTKDGGKDYTHQVNVQCTYDEETGEMTGYYVSFVNTEGFSTFTVTADAVGLTYTDSEGNEQSDTYSDLQSALNSARYCVKDDCTDVTVKLLVDDLEEGNLMIPAGVTLDLNGMYVKAANVLSFGSVIDTADEAGGIVITNDRSEAYVQLQTDNEYLPIYDTTYSDEIGCYRFYKYKVVNLGGIKYGTNAVMFGIRIVFEKTKAYAVLGNTTDSDVELSTALNWGKDLAYTFNAKTMTDFGAAAYVDLTTNSDKTTTSKAIFLIVSGLSALGEGGTISSQPTVESVTGTAGIGELKQYSTAAAE